MRKVAKHIFTEKDNETFCMGRISWGSSFVAVCSLGVLSVLSGGTVTVVELAIALSTIAAGHGAALKLKETTEHK
jgi:hydrogenase/urease accessory protein HupE